MTTAIAATPWTGTIRLADVVLPAAALTFIAVGVVLPALTNVVITRETVWFAGLVLTGAPTAWRTLRGVIAGHFATDLVAMLAIVTAAFLGQPFAGLIVVLMQTGGEALERFAEGRASSALRALEAAAPRRAHRLVASATIEDIDVGDIRVADTLVVRPGELVPCDAEVVAGTSHVDESRLTGEPMPMHAVAGAPLMSGSVNLEGSLTVRARAVAAESQYARIVELVRTARSSRAPLQRLADKYAVWFTPITLVVCVATFVFTRDWMRVLSVLVVATPCPLILATPVAIVGGISRAARRQIIVRSGGALEHLASIDVAVFDKTGTLTIGRPAVSRIVPATGFTEEEVLRLAGSVEQGSSHLLARTIVERALENGQLDQPTEATESFGRGVTGVVGPSRVIVGGRSYLRERLQPSEHVNAALQSNGGLRAFVAIDGTVAGSIEFADRVRPGLADVFAGLADVGVRRTILLSGDDQAHTRAIADAVGIADARGDLLPEHKLRIIDTLMADGARVLMIGDGTNDAPALERATVGIALAAHGGGIAAEAADVVILADDLGRVGEAMRISRDTLRIARQSIWTGLTLSGIAMACASAGMIPPVAGALLQEAIDVAVIVNALRASRAPRALETG